MLAQTSRIILEAEALGSILRILAGHINRARIFLAAKSDVWAISLWHDSLTFLLIIQIDKWSPERGLNSRPLPYHGSALPLSYLGKQIHGAG